MPPCSRRAPWGAQNRSKIDLGAPGPPGSLQGAILEPFWTHFGPPGASCISLLAFRRLLCLIPALRLPRVLVLRPLLRTLSPSVLRPPLGGSCSCWTLRGIIFQGFLPSTRSTKTVANTVRNHCSKHLFETSERQMRDTLLAQWPVWGAHAPTGDPATEPSGSTWGRGAKRLRGIREHPDKTQRLPFTVDSLTPSHWRCPPAAGPLDRDPKSAVLSRFFERKPSNP